VFFSRKNAPIVAPKEFIDMSETTLFQTHLVLGYVAWLLCFGVYVWPRLKAADHFSAQRAIATLHSFRFFGLVFILPGVVGPGLPASFATPAAYGDLATSVLALLALLVARRRPLFWLFVAAFNVVGIVDLAMNYGHAIQAGVPAAPGELGAAYAIPVIYVPLLMITHVAAIGLMVRAMSHRRRGAALHA
jgi:nicotinamide riboside transporter PnuC